MKKSGAERRRWVVKVGSSLLTNNGRGLDLTFIRNWAEQVVQLRAMGIECVLVSSGAVAEGLNRLGFSKRPSAVHELQAAAAVGQMGLIQAYESCFSGHGIHTAQILLTHDDLASRERYLNARSTLRTLLELNVVPIVNENDTVATEEIKVGDNDTLGALVANLVEADQLVLLTDQPGLYTADPRKDPDAKFVHEAKAGDPELEKMAGGAGTLGRGGMITKIRAAARAARSGAATIIAPGRGEDVFLRLAANDKTIGTWLYPAQEVLLARKQWLAAYLQLQGRLTLDDGAVKVLRGAGKSLLPVGVKRVDGEFQRGEVVACLDMAGREIARGLVNYSADEARKIVGHSSAEIEKILGYVDEPELIHRDNLVLI